MEVASAELKTASIR